MPDQHPAVTFLLAAHEHAIETALATTPVPLAGQWCVVRDKHAGPDAPLALVQGEDVPQYDGEDREDYRYGVPVIALAADWQTEAEANLRHIALHDPRSVLLRVAEERTILAEHAAWREDPGFCRACMAPTGIGSRWDCSPHPFRTVIGLARAWGWKDLPWLTVDTFRYRQAGAYARRMNLNWHENADVYLKAGHGITTSQASGNTRPFGVDVAFADGFLFIKARNDGRKIHVVPGAGVDHVELSTPES